MLQGRPFLLLPRAFDGGFARRYVGCYVVRWVVRDASSNCNRVSLGNLVAQALTLSLTALKPHRKVAIMSKKLVDNVGIALAPGDNRATPCDVLAPLATTPAR